MKEINTSITNFFSKKVNRIFEIITITGRKLKCTSDHPILIRKNNIFTMVNAEDLVVGDQCTIRNHIKHIVCENIDYTIKYASLNPEYVNEFKRLNMLDKNIPNNVLEKISKLIGVIISKKGKLIKEGNDFSVEICINTIDNLNMLLEDIKTIIGYLPEHDDPILLNDKTINITIKNNFLGYFLNIMKLFPSRDYNYYLEPIIPQWIISGNKKIKRAFLSGMCIGNLNIKDNKISLKGNFKLSMTNSEYFFMQIEEMFKEFDISVDIQYNNSEGLYNIDFNNKDNIKNYDNIIKYFDNIDISYMTDLSKELLLLEYVKYQKYTNIEKYNLYLTYDEFVNKYNVNNFNITVPIDKINIINEETTVYDFTTTLDTHTIIANSFITSNCSSTPEHAKVGLTKHTSLIGSVTIMSREQYYQLKNYINKKVKPVSNISLIDLKNGIYYKLFFNGQWLGGTDKYIELEKEFQEMKLKGIFDRKNVSIIVDHNLFEVRIYCDSGRLIRPMLRVEDNIILLKKEHINQISLNKSNRATKITTWEEFINKFPYLIEYICMEQQPYLMLAESSKKVENMRKRMVESIDKVKNIKSNHTDNRYDDFSYNRYTHCEIHQSLLLAEIVASMQFCNHAPGTRNMFQYAQGKQAMGIPTDVHNHRYDLCFVAYNPQRRMVTTRASKYTMAEQLPSGENAIVAVATYTGYNQEDAIVVNKTSADRGKYLAMYKKKIIISIQKNMSTGGDDIFMKPNVDELIDKRTVNYEMLNDEGYAPEETLVEKGVVLFGKVTPVSNPIGNKKYKDSSEIYKQDVPGYVDRVEIKIQNPDGYELRKMSVRTERYPNCGDKFCCYDDQTEILTDKGWILFKDLTYDHSVATLVDGNTLVYSCPLEIMNYEYSGIMYSTLTKNINLVVTPNHRMYVKYNNEFEIILAEDIYKKKVTYMNTVHSYLPELSEKLKLDKMGEIMYNCVLPEWVWNLNNKDSLYVLNYIIYSNSGSTTINSSNLYYLNDIQRLSLHSGCYSTIINNNTNDNDYIDGIYKLIIYKKPSNLCVNNNITQDDNWIYYRGIVYCCNVEGDGIIYVRRNNLPVWCGNSNFGNKGTIGLLLNSTDMPYTSNGMIPDLIINPHAFPGRMTAGQIIECLHAKAGAIIGRTADGTQFEETDIKPIKKILKDNGFNESGKEYLYNGMTGQIMPVMIFIGPTYYQRLRHLVEDKIHCVDDITEVLTDNGWKYIKDVIFTDKIATLENNKLVYSNPINILEYTNYTGEMYSIQSNNIDLFVTTNHRMWVSDVNDNNYNFVLASDVNGKNVKYKKNAVWVAVEYDLSDNINTENQDDWLVFFGIWLCYGFQDNDSIIFNVDNQLKIKILSILNVLNFNYIVEDNKISIYDDNLFKILINTKNEFPEWIWKLSQRQCRLIIDINEFNLVLYNTKLSNNIMRLVLHAGYTSDKYNKIMYNNVTCEENKLSDTWCINIREYNEPLSSNGIESISNSYNRTVYCLQVPSEVFYVRRNGKTVWTGNSRARGPVSMLTRQAPEGRARDGGLRIGEMERDALIAHGIALFAKEKLLDNADAYKTFICGQCGLFAQRFVTEDEDQEILSYFCPQCNNHNDIHKVIMPYAFKLLLQECISLCIAPRMRFKKQ